MFPNEIYEIIIIYPLTEKKYKYSTQTKAKEVGKRFSYLSNVNRVYIKINNNISGYYEKGKYKE